METKFTDLPIEIVSTIADVDTKSLNKLLRLTKNYKSDDLLYNITKIELLEDNAITDNHLMLMPNLTKLILPSNRKISNNGLNYLNNLEVLILSNNKYLFDLPNKIIFNDFIDVTNLKNLKISIIDFNSGW
jgi:hypothetical protein